jgi:competence protein ComEA
MVLALIEHRPDGGANLRAFANYPELQLFNAPHFVGRVGYVVQGAEVVLEAEAISNPRAGTNLSGTLALELWAFPQAGPATEREGVRLAWSKLQCIAGQSQITAIERRVAFTEPPEGRFGLSLILGEWTAAHGYVARDRRDFACIYEAGAKELPGSSAVGALVQATAQPPPARPIDRLRLVPSAAEPGAPAPAATAAATEVTSKPKPESAPPAGPRLISIQTGSLEELAGVKGLSLKIAKEIVKARPFSSLADLIRVRGIGDKTIAQIKHLLTL